MRLRVTIIDENDELLETVNVYEVGPGGCICQDLKSDREVAADIIELIERQYETEEG